MCVRVHVRVCARVHILVCESGHTHAIVCMRWSEDNTDFSSHLVPPEAGSRMSLSQPFHLTEEDSEDRRGSPHLNFAWVLEN